MKLIASLIVFYPLIIPIWKQEPLHSKNTIIPRARTFIDKNEIKWQAEKFKEIKDPRIKSKIVFELTKSNNPETIKQLILLLKYADDKLKADILLSLYSMKHIQKCGNSAIFHEFMSNKNDQIRAYSTALYLNNSGKINPVLNMLETENSDFVINFIKEELIRKGDISPIEQLEKLARSNNPKIRAIAADILPVRKENPDNSDTIAKIADDPEIEVRAALSQSLSKKDSGGTKLLKKLSEDKSAIVRGNVASSKPTPDMLPTYIKLTADPDFEVRRLAAVSLGNFNTPDSITTLIRLFSDETAEVRRSAEDSIIKIVPDKKVQKTIGEKSLPSVKSRAAAIRVLGELKDSRFSKQIEEYLKSTRDDDIIFRSIVALDNFGYKKAELSVNAKASHESSKIRQAAAHALGTLALKDSFATIIKLSKDPDTGVSTEAIEAMGRLSDPHFNDRLNEVLYDVNYDHSEIRAYACWSIARINKPLKKSIKQMEKLILKQAIPTEMGKEFDADYVRIAACLAFVDMGKTNQALKEKAAHCLKQIGPPSDTLVFGEISNNTLQEFSRQAISYMNGETKVEPAPLPTRSISFTVRKIK